MRATGTPAPKKPWYWPIRAAGASAKPICQEPADCHRGQGQQHGRAGQEAQHVQDEDREVGTLGVGAQGRPAHRRTQGEAPVEHGLEMGGTPVRRSGGTSPASSAWRAAASPHWAVAYTTTAARNGQKDRMTRKDRTEAAVAAASAAEVPRGPRRSASAPSGPRRRNRRSRPR